MVKKDTLFEENPYVYQTKVRKKIDNIKPWPQLITLENSIETRISDIESTSEKVSQNETILASIVKELETIRSGITKFYNILDGQIEQENLFKN
ncbi:unnamed protein product [Brachionus calyciflorus]|uniref:Uncharacterized protein n=1 Tax=Brachionus calyciflorus TaxID=104777 RepID=A0A813ZHC9_9BILA|nr:unnamed protein product [Brachionus calyciflorus]